MQQKQKEQLDILLKARKRADKVLEKRREVARKKQELEQRKEANHEEMQQYARGLTALAEESGVLALAEAAARMRGGGLRREVGYYIDYGFRGSGLQRALVEIETGDDMAKMRVSHLGLRVTWGEKEAEVRVHRGGQITFHNSILPVFPFIWRRYPRVLERMFASALEHPRPIRNTGRKAGVGN